MSRLAQQLLVLSVLWVPAGAFAQTADERGSAAAESARSVFGSEQGLVEHGIEPLGAVTPMRTVDGRAFNANLSCEASEQFLRVTMFPAGSDIGRFVVELDADLDGTVDRATNFTGPFAGVCSNGVIRCAAGTWNDCHFLQWDTASGALALAEVSQQQLGACYCFNASCGNNLLISNSQKVVSDLGTSVLTAAQGLLPRVTSTRTVVDALSIQFLGQRNACGTDSSPEQYYSRPDALAAAGVAAQAVPGTVANFVSATAVARGRGVATMRCEINRSVGANEIRKSDILNFLSATRGHAEDCGPGCLRFVLGEAGEHYYDGDSCTVFEEDMRLEVLRPDRINSVRLNRLAWNDQVQVLANGTRYYNSYPDWGDGDFPFRIRVLNYCNWGDDNDVSLNLNLLPAFRNIGTTTLRLRTAVGNVGHGFAFIEARVNESCEVGAEQIVDGCTAAAANTRCRVRNEWVDGVQTVREYLTTGLGPLASSRIVGACRLDTGNRAWWRTEREYDCLTEAPPFDLAASAERYESIHQSIDLASGAFTDRLRTSDGSYQTRLTSVPVLPERGSSACTPTCRTRKVRPGANVSTAGPTTALNVTGVAYDFSFKDCESGNRCPVEAGEEVVAACDCHNNFAQAVAMMQTIRMVAEDASCEVVP